MKQRWTQITCNTLEAERAVLNVEDKYLPDFAVSAKHGGEKTEAFYKWCIAQWAHWNGDYS